MEMSSFPSPLQIMRCPSAPMGDLAGCCWLKETEPVMLRVRTLTRYSTTQARTPWYLSPSRELIQEMLPAIGNTNIESNEQISLQGPEGLDLGRIIFVGTRRCFKQGGKDSFCWAPTMIRT
jgi:hypothetical protein